MKSPAGWGWTSGDTSDIAEDSIAAKTEAERHAVPGGTVTVEFLLRSDPPVPGPICHTGSGYRGQADDNGTVTWEAVSNIASDTAGKPACADLGISPDTLKWERSGTGDDAIEVAFPDVKSCPPGYWTLLRARGQDPLLFDWNEWNAFKAGVVNGEFDIDPASLAEAS